MKTDSQTPDTGTKRPRRKRWRWLLWLLAILFLPTFSVLAYKEYRYRREIALMRAEGLPTSLEELEAWRGKLKPEEDATDLWLAAAAECERAEHELLAKLNPPGSCLLPDELYLPYVVEYSSPPVVSEAWRDLEKAEKYLKHFEACLELTRRAMEKGRIRLSVDWSDQGIASSLRIYRLCRLLKLAALVDFHRNRHDKVFMTAVAFLSLSNDLRNGQAEAYLWPAAEESRSDARDLVCWLVLSEYSSSVRLRSLLKRMENVDTTKEHEHSLTVDSVRVIEKWPPYEISLGLETYPIPGWLVKDELLKYYRQAAAACMIGLPESIDCCAQSLTEQRFGIINSLQFFRIQESSYENHAWAQAVLETSTRELMLAIAFRLYWDELGKLPAKLSELHPYVAARATIDPFTGKEFRYERKDVNRAVVTGVGADRLFRDEEGGKNGADLTIEIVLPENQR